MTIERRNFPQFFITASGPCPYLPGRMERKVFTHLVGPDAKNLNTQLSHGGFRRSQNIAYRPACDGCSSCVSVRVPVEQFRMDEELPPDAANATTTGSALSCRQRPPVNTIRCFRTYIDHRHSEGGMAEMTVLDFAAMVDDTLVDSRIIEYRIPTAYEPEGELIACCSGGCAE